MPATSSTLSSESAASQPALSREHEKVNAWKSPARNASPRGDPTGETTDRSMSSRNVRVSGRCPISIAFSGSHRSPSTTPVRGPSRVYPRTKPTISLGRISSTFTERLVCSSTRARSSLNHTRMRRGLRQPRE